MTVRVRFILILILSLGMSACRSDEDVSSSAQVTPTLTDTSSQPTPSAPTPEITPPTPSPTPCVPNPEWRDVYMVQQDDTLGAIAVAAGVTIKMMQDSNCLEDRDILQVGQELRVPNALSLHLINSPEGLAGVVAFVRVDENGYRDLWTVKSDGSIPRQITREQLVIGLPVRSSDLDWISFRAVSPFHLPTDDYQGALTGLPSDIWAVRADGNGLKQLVDQGPANPIYRSLPTWSPDSIWVAFIEQRGEVGSLVMVQSDSTHRTVITTADFIPPDALEPLAPVWSPDSTVLAAVSWSEADEARLQTFTPEARTEQMQTLISDFDYGAGPFWVELDEEIALAVGTATSNLSRIEWLAVDPETGDVLTQAEWLMMSNGEGWMIQQRGGGLQLIGPDGPVDQILPLSIDAISWGPQGTQLVTSEGAGGLLFFDLENEFEQSITEGYDLVPVWTPPRWVVR